MKLGKKIFSFKRILIKNLNQKKDFLVFEKKIIIKSKIIQLIIKIYIFNNLSKS